MASDISSNAASTLASMDDLMINATSLSPIFSTTSTGIVLTTVTGILSAVSSVLILNVIRKSPQKLNTTYHRIMALMSIFDIMASVCMALTTLPMPSDDVIRFEGPMLGNQLTCTIQGYILILGIVGGNALYMCLSWYFVCKMTFNISSHVIARRIEPIFYIMTFGFALFLPSYYLSKDMINVAPRDQFCVVGFSHAHCNYTIEYEFYECSYLEGSSPKYSEFEKEVNIITYVIGSTFAVVIVAMLIIICTIQKNHRSLRDAQNQKHDTDGNQDSHIMDLRYSRVLIIQALLYIFAYFITWAFMITPSFLSLHHDQSNILQGFKSILFPMQGFWNLIIFLYDKSYLLQQQESNDGIRGFLKTMKIVLFHPDRAPGIILPPSLRNKNNSDTIPEDVNVHDPDDLLEASSYVNQYIIDDNQLSPDPRTLTFTFSKEEMDQLSSESSTMSSITTNIKNKFHNDSEVEYLGEGNLRFFVGKNGLKRTGRVEDTRRTQTSPLSTSRSIESLSSGGLVYSYDGSVNSGSLGTSLSRKQYFLHDIVEDGEGSSKAEETNTE